MSKPDGRQFYLAGPFRDQGLMKQRRALMTLAGYNVVSSWIDEPATSDLAVSYYYQQSNALKDWQEVKDCDVLVVFPGSGAGHHTEFGIALQLDKQLVVVGKKNNIFHQLPEVVHFDTMDEFLDELGKGNV